jgi:hypothetical protein
MITRIDQLAARREALITEAHAQRAQAADVGAEIRAGLGFVDRGTAFLRSLRRKPLAVAVGLAAATLLIARSRAAVKWLGYGLTVYTLLRRVRHLLSASTRPD